MEIYCNASAFNGHVSKICLIIIEKGTLYTKKETTTRELTQNEAVYLSLVSALMKMNQGGIVYCDDKTVLNQINGLHEVKNDKLRLLYKSVTSLMTEKKVAIELVTRASNLAAKVMGRSRNDVYVDKHRQVTNKR